MGFITIGNKIDYLSLSCVHVYYTYAAAVVIFLQGVRLPVYKVCVYLFTRFTYLSKQELSNFFMKKKIS